MLKKISLKNFRNFGKKEINFEKNIIFIFGKNSVGKTNLLEAVYFLINGFGFREDKEKELINLGKEEGFVQGEFLKKDEVFSFTITFRLKNNLVEKKYFLEKTEKNFYQYINEQEKTVLFSPDQIAIVNGSPSIRRDYLNKIISFEDKEYKKKLNNYLQALKKRNKILESLTDEKTLKKEISFWNEYLIKEAQYIFQKRREYVDFLNKNSLFDGKKIFVDYQKSEVNQAIFQKNYLEERRLKKTLSGPQKDDFQIFLNQKNIHSFGSRSEQRMAVFWLKVNEVKRLEDVFNIKPIILLDDIFSEFDFDNQKKIIGFLKNYQIISTTTEEKIIKNLSLPCQIIYLN